MSDSERTEDSQSADSMRTAEVTGTEPRPSIPIPSEWADAAEAK